MSRITGWNFSLIGAFDVCVHMLTLIGLRVGIFAVQKGSIYDVAPHLMISGLAVIDGMPEGNKGNLGQGCRCPTEA